MHNRLKADFLEMHNFGNTNVRSGRGISKNTFAHDRKEKGKEQRQQESRKRHGTRKKYPLRMEGEIQ